MIGGNIVNSFAWELRKESNNQAEWMALMLGVEIIAKLGISRIVIIGDSMQVIQKMQTGYKNGNIRCKRIHRKIFQISSKIKISPFHILQENNGDADLLANKGALLEPGLVSYANGDINFHAIP